MPIAERPGSGTPAILRSAGWARRRIIRRIFPKKLCITMGLEYAFLFPVVKKGASIRNAPYAARDWMRLRMKTDPSMIILKMLKHALHLAFRNP